MYVLHATLVVSACGLSLTDVAPLKGVPYTTGTTGAAPLKGVPYATGTTGAAPLKRVPYATGTTGGRSGRPKRPRRAGSLRGRASAGASTHTDGGRDASSTAWSSLPASECEGSKER